MEMLSEVRFLQLLCAVWFVPHIAGKILNFDKAKGTFEAAGFRPGAVFLVLTVIMEILAALGLLFGVQTRLAGIFGALVLLGAAYAVVRINGMNWRWQKMGPEYPIFWAFLCLVAGFAGAD